MRPNQILGNSGDAPFLCAASRSANVPPLCHFTRFTRLPLARKMWTSIGTPAAFRRVSISRPSPAQSSPPLRHRILRSDKPLTGIQFSTFPRGVRTTPRAQLEWVGDLDDRPVPSIDRRVRLAQRAVASDGRRRGPIPLEGTVVFVVNVEKSSEFSVNQESQAGSHTMN